MFTLQPEQCDKILVLRFSGDMTFTEAPELLHELGAMIYASPGLDIILDLQALQHVDSSGVGALVSALTKARSYGKRLLLYRQPEHFSTLLTKVDINGFFPTVEGEDDFWWLISQAERQKETSL